MFMVEILSNRLRIIMYQKPCQYSSKTNHYSHIQKCLVNLYMSPFKLDRTAFKAQTAKEAANHAPYYLSLTWQERLRIANYLNSIAFNYPEDCPPKMDKTKFSVRSRS